MSTKFNRNLYLLLGGQLVSQLGDKFYALALAYWVLQTTKSSAMMGILLFFSMAPSVLVGFVSGSFVDRFNRKTILIVSDIFRGIVISAVAVIFYIGTLNLGIIITAEILLSISSAFFNPAVSAVIPQIVDKDNIARANAKSQLIGGLTLILGPALGGSSVAYLGYGFAFIVNALSFMASAVFEIFLNIDSDQRELVRREKLKENIGSGFKYIFNKKKILIIIFIVAIIHFFVGSIQVVIPVFANSAGGNGAVNQGYIQMLFGIGVVLTALILNIAKINDKEDKIMFRGIFAIGILFILFSILGLSGISSKLPLFLAFSSFSSAIIVISTCYQVILQKNVEKHISGRVFAIVGSVGNFSLPLAYLVFGFILGTFNVFQVLLFCGICAILACIVLYCLFNNKKSEEPEALENFY
ncbi:MAG: MFS transporter [Bacillota bacterium]|nr:MFS transporter [Bacillota bacterium]